MITKAEENPDRIDRTWEHVGVVTRKYYFVAPDKNRNRDAVLFTYHALNSTPEKEAVVEAWEWFEKKEPIYFELMKQGKLAVTLQYELSKVLVLRREICN